jgi:hypothetical protein
MSDPTPVPAPPTVSEPAGSTVYRPLSLLALVGLGLAGVYAVVVVLGTLLAFFHGEPLLLGWWSLIPLAAAVLSLVGLKQIQGSEGTLAGEKAAQWGLLLSALVGLSYWAYLGVTYIAISNEAEKFGRGFLGKLAGGEEFAGFLLTRPRAERPSDGPGLRDQLEGRFNGLDPQGRKGPLGLFRQSETVRMLRLGGANAIIESQGVDSWDYLGGGYQVRLKYRITQPQSTYFMVVTVVGKEGTRSEGRQWYVDWNKTGMPPDTPPQVTPEGLKLFAVSSSAREYLMQDLNKAMREERVVDLFLATLPPADRDAARKSATVLPLSFELADMVGAGALPCAAPGAALTRVGPISDLDFARAAALPGYSAFVGGDLVRTEEGAFWGPEDVREDMVKAVREMFRHPNAKMAAALTPEGGARFPIIKQEGDRLTIALDVSLSVPAGAPRYMVDGLLLCECDAAEAEAGPVKTWRIRRLDLVAGRMLPTGPAGAGQRR